MKTTLFALFAFVALFTSALSAEILPASHQNYSKFANVTECKAAFLSGEDVTPYQPKFQGSFVNQNKVNDVTIVKGPLPAYACARGFTTAGDKTVLLPIGMEMRWHARNGIATGTPLAMHYCGNPIYEFSYIEPTAPPPAPVVVEAVMGPQGPEGPQGPPGRPGIDCVPVVRKGFMGLRSYTHLQCGDKLAFVGGHTTGRGKGAAAVTAAGVGLVIRNNWCSIVRALGGR